MSGKERSLQSQTVAFKFQVGDRTVEAYYHKGKGLRQLSLGEAALLAIGQSSAFSQTPATQAEFIQTLAGKTDTGEKTSFEARFQGVLENELDEGRVSIGNEGRLQLTDESLPIIDEAIERTRAGQRFSG
jgi:hypothetical protein